VVKYSWQIVAKAKTYTVYAGNQGEKDSWMDSMNQVIEALVTKDPSLLGKTLLLIVPPPTRGLLFGSRTVFPSFPCACADQRASINVKSRGVLSWLSESVGLTYGPQQFDPMYGSSTVVSPQSSRSTTPYHSGLPLQPTQYDQVQPPHHHNGGQQ
jgi:hypothetical protein